jgi:hypothetical protein
VEVELTKTIRQRAQVVVTTECDYYDEDVLFEIENEADRTIKKGGNSIVWTDVPGTEQRGGNPKYRISPVGGPREEINLTSEMNLV